jgi:glucose/arabinose dehydrogenase
MSLNTSSLLKAGALVASLAIIAGGVMWWFRDDMVRWFFQPTTSSIQEGVRATDNKNDIQTVAERLMVPWEVAFIPGSIDILVTERSGTIKRIGANGATYVIRGVEHTSEGGLMGLVLHPKFVENKWIYLYYTTKDAEGGLINTIERYALNKDTLSDKKVIITDIPAAANHDGGRLAFGPDGFLYITTGDAGQQDLAQDTSSLAGKILRVTDEGSLPTNNPFSNAVYSYGHRNVQGITWDDKGRLWATEHGPSGSQTGYDELNHIEKGQNYGWPVIRGNETHKGMRTPVVQSGGKETWAPGGMAYANGSLYFAGLRGESLYEAKIINANKVSLKAHFKGDYGRLRTVVHKDDMLYLTTSNTDGRGSPKANDDRIYRFTVDTLKN